MEVLEFGWMMENIEGIEMGKRRDEMEYNILFIRRSLDDK
jgi:hypothetical protein